MATLVDSNVLLDIVERDPQWHDWSFNSLLDAQERGPVFLNAMVYAEVSIGFVQVRQLDEVVKKADLRWLDIPREAAFLAGKAFLAYRQRGGARRSPLPDFFIGAHAALVGMPLLTRDAARYRSYFPELRLIAP
ncbi:MAG: type II toxin-antitoxin system VapC family toxin [Gammaproteobacteria bacterium]|nr:type II toxin-antitoxin system VapC family toxin [Gammaproteobacteria bacterium]